jgi:hypothetical protein
VNDDAAKADEVWANDEPVDEVYNGIFREMLTFMMEDPRNITAATHLLFVAKNLERIGDHATNIAETVHYAVRGESLPDDRPKADSRPRRWSGRWPDGAPAPRRGTHRCPTRRPAWRSPPSSWSRTRCRC